MACACVSHSALDSTLVLRSLLPRVGVIQVSEARRAAARLRRRVSDSQRDLDKVQRLDEAARRRLERKQAKLQQLQSLQAGGSNRCARLPVYLR